MTPAGDPPMMSDSKLRPRAAAWLTLAVLVAFSPACASHPRPLALASTRDALAGLDEFGALLLGAGLPIELIPEGRAVSPPQAKRIRFTLTILPALPQHYAPRFVADELLAFIASQAQPVSRWDLTAKVQEYRNLFLLRPDGYLADALTGKPALCVGPIEFREDSAGAGVFDMGVFYTSTDGMTWPRAAVPVLATP
jgi:hypothetical protein